MKPLETRHPQITEHGKTATPSANPTGIPSFHLNPVRQAEQAAAAERRAVDAHRTAQRLRLTIAAQFLSGAIDVTDSAVLYESNGAHQDAQSACEVALFLADMLIAKAEESAGPVGPPISITVSSMDGAPDETIPGGGA